MKKTVVFLAILAIAGTAWAGDEKYNVYKSGDPGFCANVERNPEFKEEIINGIMTVTVTEWQGYCGDSPNRSYPLDKLIAMAKAKYHKYRLISVTKEEDKPVCVGSNVYCHRMAWLTFEPFYIERKKTDNPKEKSCRWEYEFLLLYPKMQPWWKGQSSAPPESVYMTWGEIVNEALKKYPRWEVDEKRFIPNRERYRQEHSGTIEVWLKRRVCE
uniref:Uncharacterized protein n=1 Tax=viral metagenome TaxID=1070528 RepID=A0A6H1ZKI4_9ZZZZ